LPLASELDAAVQAGRFDDASAAFAVYRAALAPAVTAMEAAQRWSLFDRQIHDAHYAALHKMYQAGSE